MNRPSKISEHKIYWLLIVVALVALVGTGCGPEPTPTNAPEATPIPVADEPETSEAEPEPTVAPVADEPETSEAEPEPTVAPVEEVPEFAAETFRAAIFGTEGTLNPYTYITGFPGLNLMGLIYDNLLTYDANGVPQPWLASDYEISEDYLVYTIHLRDDVTWHDGKPFTAEDVAFTYGYYKAHERPPWGQNVAPVVSAEAVDDYTVKITLEAPNAEFVLNGMNNPPMMPKHIWETIDVPLDYAFTMAESVGTGPYKLVAYEPDQYYRLEANLDFWGGTPTVKVLEFIQFGDLPGALAAFQTHEIDMIFDSVPAEQIQILGSIDGVKLAQGPLFSSQMLNYDMQKPPFDQPEVRQAISLAIDRQEIVDVVFLGAATVGSPGFVHPNSPVFNPDLKAEYDPDKANALLDGLGIVDSDGDGVREFDGAPMSYEILTESSSTLALRSSELLGEMLLEIGIKTEVASLETGTWAELIWPGYDVSNGRNYDIGMWGWSPTVLLIPSKFTLLFHSEPAKGALNLTGYVSEEMDALIDRLATENDPDTRKATIQEIQALIAADLPIATILYPDGIFPYWASVYDDLVFISGDGPINKLTFLPPEARP